jgi:predicted metal-dependent phosphoesterase TrpH
MTETSAEPPRYGIADLHIHTSGSDGVATPEQVLDYVQRCTRLSVVAITDHDDLAPSLRAREAHARSGCSGFEIVTGMEVTTIEGHLLALFVEERVASFHSLPATLDAIHRQGGLAVIPHPMSPLTRSIGRHGIERILRRRADGLWFDGIELANQSPAGRIVARRAAELNQTSFHLAAVGGSDAHYLPVVGASYTTFEGGSAAELRRAILEGRTRPGFGRQPSLSELGAGLIARQTLRAAWATPSKVLGRPVRRLATLAASTRQGAIRR